MIHAHQRFSLLLPRGNRRILAVFLCAVFSFGVLMPAIVGLVAIPIPVHAQDEEMGSLLMFVLLLSMLMQMLQNLGGATPQQGAAEESPPIPPTAEERFQTGSRERQEGSRGITQSSSGGQEGPFSSSHLLFFTEDDTIIPPTLSLEAGDFATLFNPTNESRDVTIRKKESGESAVEQHIDAMQSYTFRFSNRGEYSVCFSVENSEQCPVTITVK